MPRTPKSSDVDGCSGGSSLRPHSEFDVGCTVFAQQTSGTLNYAFRVLQDLSLKIALVQI